MPARLPIPVCHIPTLTSLVNEFGTTEFLEPRGEAGPVAREWKSFRIVYELVPFFYRYPPVAPKRCCPLTSKRPTRFSISGNRRSNCDDPFSVGRMADHQGKSTCPWPVNPNPEQVSIVNDEIHFAWLGSLLLAIILARCLVFCSLGDTWAALLWKKGCGWARYTSERLRLGLVLMIPMQNQLVISDIGWHVI